MANGQQEFDLIGIRLNQLIQPFCEQLENLCDCIKEVAQQPAVAPCQSYPLFYKGSITQTFVCHVATTAFQVPPGQTATITRIAITERYPGTLYGANVALLINDNFSPNFPRLDHVQGGLESGSGTRICLEEQDIVSLMLQCSWFPVSFTGMSSTYSQTLFPFQIEGFFEYKRVA